MDQEKLNTFIRLLQKVKKQPSQTFDLGLIVKEPKSTTSSNKVLKATKKIIDIEKIVYDKSSIDGDIIENLVNVFTKDKWVFLEIKKDISSPLLNQLKHLANFNSFQLLDYKGENVFEMKMPENSRLIIFAERDFIENKISYPHFYRLFGPILSLE
jgi:hypothetical protein